jgi:hypothetical protein
MIKLNLLKPKWSGFPYTAQQYEIGLNFSKMFCFLETGSMNPKLKKNWWWQ